jgi:formylglycine-generating enzyme required for sulfatase activity
MPIRQHTIFPAAFPESWASDWGEDEYGLWMGFTYKGVRQDFRWIEPGAFLMGSPKSEPGRSGNETQHQVTLTEGFWLAKTTVTQALWEVVMGDNPSQFKGENRPVEQVSWDDAQRFITKMNGMKSELQMCLPTEAQWEYCCRAGTITPFHFGGENDLNLERVNYSGRWDNYDFMGKTKAVTSYTPNDWGLYEMHGNVLEWCQDCYGDYPAQPIVDPKGAEVGYLRVLRGGSWISDGRYCRSANRYRSDPAYRDYYYGFRLVLCHRAVQPAPTDSPGAGVLGRQAGDG